MIGAPGAAGPRGVWILRVLVGHLNIVAPVHVGAAGYFALDGAGDVEVGGERGDSFVVPGHRWRRFVDPGPDGVTLYICIETPLMEKLGH